MYLSAVNVPEVHQTCRKLFCFLHKYAVYYRFRIKKLKHLAGTDVNRKN